MKKLQILTLITVILSVLSSCKLKEPVGTIKDLPFKGANQIIATSSDSIFFDKFLNNLKMNGFAFENVDRVNGFVSVKSKNHPKYNGPYNIITMYPVISYIKEDNKYTIIFSGTYYQDYTNGGTDNSGEVKYMKYKYAPRIVWDEFVRQFDGIANVTITYRRN
jgi:hypothetical protein